MKKIISPLPQALWQIPLPGVSVLLALFLLISFGACDLENPEVGISTDEIITLAISKPSIPADGVTAVDITATLGAKADANRTVTFTADQGVFSGTGGASFVEVLASSKTATVRLVSDDVANEEVVVSATVDGFTTAIIFPFDFAYPEQMLIAPQTISLPADPFSSTDAEIQLFRTVGTPSQNALVELEAIPLDTAALDIVPFVYAEGSSAIVSLKSQNGKAGSVALIAITSDGQGGVIRDTAMVNFQ